MSEPVSTVEFRLGNWVVSPRLNQLQRRRRLVKVTPRVMEVLCELARRAPQPASRQELMEAVWAGRYVGDESLTHAVSELRKALGDNTKHPRYVQTIPKRGYRLLEMPTAVSARDGTGRRRAWASHAPGSESDGAAPPGYPKARARQFRPATLLPVVGVFAVAAGLATLMLVAGPGSEGNPTEPLVTPVTSLPGSEWQPALSPDGERLAFEWQEHINLTVIGSAAAEAITDGPTIDSDPAWSADGARIAFARRGRGECDIHVLVLNLGEDKRVGSCDPDGPQGLSWHPSGLWLAISDRSGPVGRFEIQMLSLATGERHPLLAGDREPRSVGGDIEPSFSPEGRRLAWAQSLIGGTAIRVVEVAGHPPVARGEPATVLQAETEIRGLDWTADGRKLVFATGRAEAAPCGRSTPRAASRSSSLSAEKGSRNPPSLDAPTASFSSNSGSR